MTTPLVVGDIIHGFAYGAFGRDHYNCVRIEAVGPDWIVARDPEEDRGPSFAAGRRLLKFCQQARDEGHRAAVERAGGEGDEPCPLAEVDPPLTAVQHVDPTRVAPRADADPDTLPPGMNWRDHIGIPGMARP